MSRSQYLFTSESVSEGHPDKVCDRISDAVVDLFLGADPHARVAVETMATTNRVILAGAFGAYINVRSAIAIGLLLDLPREKFEQVGNAAGLGIRQMLAARGARVRAAEIASRCRYVELSTRTEFQKTFMYNIGFRRVS